MCGNCENAAKQKLVYTIHTVSIFRLLMLFRLVLLSHTLRGNTYLWYIREMSQCLTIAQ